MTAYLPYGVTVNVPSNGGNPALLSPQIITDLQGWQAGGMLPRLRYQLKWSDVERAQGVYTWTNADDAVAKCNAAGIYLVWNLQSAPSWYLTISAADGSTVAAGTGDLPNASAVATFAAAVAARYNGLAGHGTLQAIQIGDEDWDLKNPRDQQSQWLVPVMNAAYPAVKAAYPTCPVGVCAVRKTPTTALSHITNWLTNLYTYAGGIGTNGDFLDFHYYRDGSFNPDPMTQNADVPSVATELATILGIARPYNPNVEVWCAETGWPVYDDGSGTIATVTWNQQADYIREMYDALRIGGAACCLVYTLNPASTVNTSVIPATATEKDSITQIIHGAYTYLPAYAMTAAYAQQYPTWTPQAATPVIRPREISKFTVQRDGVTVAEHLRFQVDNISLSVIAASGGAIPQNSYMAYSLSFGKLPDVRTSDLFVDEKTGYAYRVKGNPQYLDGSHVEVLLVREVGT